MRVLTVNKFYYIKGGSEAYYFSLNKLLNENGIELIPFSMKDEKNFASKYDEYFVDNISYEKMGLKTKVINSGKIIYSLEAQKKIRKIVRETKPDIAHLHLFQHQLSPPIIHVLKKERIPIVNTVHDLKVICPNYKMLNSKGICEQCKGSNYYNCFKNSCVKGSKIYSLVNVFEAYVHKLLKSYSYVDKYICPSDFYRRKLIEFGIPQDKVVYIPNFIDISKFRPSLAAEDYFIYFGRLSEEKGILTLVGAMKNIKKSKLYIVGTGPLEDKLKKQVLEFKLNNVKFLGFKSGHELEQIISNSKFVVIPSEWYENCPMSVIEAMAYGKAVLGSNLGGIPELIESESTGLVFKAGDSSELALKINWLLDNPEKCRRMGRIGRVRAEELLDKKIHYEKINELYKSLLVRS